MFQHDDNPMGPLGKSVQHKHFRTTQTLPYNTNTKDFVYVNGTLILKRVSTNTGLDDFAGKYGIQGGGLINGEGKLSTDFALANVDFQAPDAVQYSSINVSSGYEQVGLTWTAPSDPGRAGVHHYDVTRNGAHIDSPTSAAITDTTVSPNLTYTYTYTYTYTITAVDLARQQFHSHQH